MQGTKAWHLPKARALGEHLAPNPLPAPLQAGKLHRRWGLPSTTTSGLLNPFWGATLLPAFLWVSNYHPSPLLPLLSSLICSSPSLFTIIIITIKGSTTQTLVDWNLTPASGPFGRRECSGVDRAEESYLEGKGVWHLNSKWENQQLCAFSWMKL